jgi:hypothetical protein
VTWTWNSVVNRRLWRTFRVHARRAISTAAVHDCLDVLLSRAARARCVRNLIIGPITWQWDVGLLQKMISLWAAIPLLSKLTFDDTCPNSDLSHGREFTPVIRGLLDYGTHIQLHSFTFRHHMTPNSPLERFLAAQPSIQHLDGIHSLWTTYPAVTSSFLPALQAISCGAGLTARLVPSRPLVSISCTASMRVAERILDAIVESATRLVFIDLRLEDTFTLEPFVRRVVRSAPGLRMIHINASGYTMYPECRRFLAELAVLEDLVCSAPYDKWNGWDPAAFSQWASPHGPRLKRILFFLHDAVSRYGGVWERVKSNGGE